MGTWKRPLPDGIACEDQRVAHNPTLGQGKTKEVEKPVEVAKPEPVKVERAKKAAVTEEPVTVEQTVEEIVKTIEEI